MADKTEKMFVTKYALTEGITSRQLSTGSGDDGYFYERSSGYWGQFKLGRDCFRTEPEAVANAEKRREKKIASLNKQIAGLQKLRFETRP